jgi:hypothetical protein
MYRKRMGDYYIDSQDINSRLAASLLDAIPFDPVFKIEDKYIRITKIAVRQGHLQIDFDPANR